MKNENITLEEWRIQNPTKSINEYYKLNRNKVFESSNSIGFNSTFNEDKKVLSDVVSDKKESSSKNYYLILLGLLFLFCFFSNPKIEEHKESFRIKLTGIVEEILTESSNNIFVIGWGKMAGEEVIKEILKNVAVDNYIFFSITKFNYASNSTLIGFGFLGTVYFTDKINKESVLQIFSNLK